MRRLWILLLFVVILAACSNNGGAGTLPSPLPDSSGTEGGVVATNEPRVEITPTPPLPPTFTPNAMAHQGHLYLLPVSGADGVIQYVYVVRPGDTLTSLSKFFGVSADDVVRVNQIRDQNLIEVGQRLVIPVTAVSAP